MKQPYVEKHIHKPFIDSDKMMFLADVYQHMDMKDTEKKQIIITVMLVQCALDTHELVLVNNDSMLSETEKQLAVLAGDYYSGLYYALLAEHGQIRMIQILANAIKQINEYKMNIYYEEANDINELIYFLMKKESLLIVSVVEEVCLLNRLKRELVAAENNDPYYITDSLYKKVHYATNTQPLHRMESEINQQLIELDQLLSLLPSSFNAIRDTIREKFSLSYHTTIAEDGYRMVEQSKEERVHHVFEKIYDKYDAMNSVISFKRHVAWRKDVMKRMNVSTGASALDVCTGTGDWAISLAEATGPEGNVVGLDFSENMLKVAQEKKELDKLSHLEFVHGNAMELSFEDDSFDFVTIGFGLRNVPDYLQVLKEMHRVVKP